MELSIITINRNNVKGLRKTIESVILQTFDDFEYIIIDGASTDGSVDVIKEYQDKISFWVSEPDAGIYNAMNKGIKQAKGDYCLFLNSGDMFADECVLHDVFSIRPCADLVYGFVEGESDTDNRIQLLPPDKFTFRYLYYKNIPHQAEFIKRSLFDKLGYYCENYRILSDYDFNIKALMASVSCFYIDRLISFVEIGGISNSDNSILIMEEERKQIFSNNIPNGIMKDYLFLLSNNSRHKTAATSRDMIRTLKSKIKRLFR